MPPTFAPPDTLTSVGPPARLVVPARIMLLRVSKGIACALLAMVVAFVCSGTVVPALLGYHSTKVYGGSMGPGLPTGSVAVSKTVSFEEVGVGDVIAFARAGSHLTVMHRVVAIEERDGQRIATLRGDGNGANDAETLVLTGQGDRLVYYVPLLGYFLHYLWTPTVLLALLLVAALALAWQKLRIRPPGAARVKA